MDTSLEYFCGIHINNEKIQGALFDADGNLQAQKYLDSPKPLMPGATTVLLCDLIQLIDLKTLYQIQQVVQFILLWNMILIMIKF